MAKSVWCVIADRNGPYFWTGSKWSEEFPDAAIYTPDNGKKELRRLGGPAQLIRNYGLETEKTIATN